MNQASRKSWLVPVLPAACQSGSCAFCAVPETSVSRIIAFIMATWRGSTMRPRVAGAGAHALDHVRDKGVAAVRERRIGAGELDQRDFGGAQRQGRIGVELRGN